MASAWGVMEISLGSMGFIWHHGEWFSILALSLSANMDNLGLGLALGVKQVRVPFPVNVLIGVVTGAATLFPVFIGRTLAKYLPLGLTHSLSTIVFVIIGLWMIQDSVRSPHSDTARKSNSDFVGWKEGLSFSLALSLNNLTGGLGGGLAGLNPWSISIVSTVFSILTLAAGQYLGSRCLPARYKGKANFFAGFLMILLGIWETVN